MDNKEMGRKMPGGTVLYSACAIVFGVAILFSPYSFMRFAAYAAAAALVVLGGSALVADLKGETGAYTTHTAASAAAVLFGIITFISPYWFIAVLPTAAGFVIVIYGAGKIKKMSGSTLDTINWGKAWPYAACMIFGVILLLDPFGAAAAGARVAAVALILSGILAIKEEKGK